MKKDETICLCGTGGTAAGRLCAECTALDTTPPPMSGKQFGFARQCEDFTRSYLGNFVHFDYDTASDMFRRYVQQLHADPSLGFSYFGLEDMDTLYRYIDYGQWKDMDDYCRQAAREMIQTADYRSSSLRCS